MKVTLLYFQTTTEQLSKKTVVVTRKEASEIFNQAVSEYQKWLELENVLHEQRQESLKMLKFPFDKYRKNQRELAVCVYKTIASKKRLFVEAPTGTGKTVSVLFPALKAMGEEKCSRIFYLTAKQSTRKSCEDAIALMKPNLRSITLTAKDKITFDEEKDLPDDQNPYFIGYYDRIRPAMQDVLKHETTSNAMPDCIRSIRLSFRLTSVFFATSSSAITTIFLILWSICSAFLRTSIRTAAF